MADPSLRRLWWAVLAVLALGELSAATAGVLPWAAVPLSLVVVAVGSRVALAAPPQRAKAMTAVASGLALVAVLAALPQVVAAGEGGPRSVLGPLLVGVQSLHALTWRGVRDLRVGLLGGAALLVLGGSFAPDLVVGIPLLLGWLVALAATALAASVRPGLAPLGARPARPAVLAPVGLAAALGLVGFLLVPIGDDVGLRQRLARTAAVLGGSDSRAALGPAVYSAGQVDLRRRGPLSDRGVARVSAGSPRLWRGAVYDRYDGGSWTAARRDERVVPGPPFALLPAAGPVRTDRAEVLIPVFGLVWAPGRVVGLDSRSAAWLTVDDAGTARLETSGAPSYVVRSTPPDDDTADEPRWTQLPGSLPPRVRELAAGLAAGRHPAGIVAAVESELQQRARYTTDSPVPGLGEDAVDRFLFVDRAGYCEQFAAAAVVLLRAAGVPARMVTGLSGGVPDTDGMRLVREKDLHAWVEAWVPGEGWVTSDPTPPSGVAEVQGTGPSVRARLARLLLQASRQAEAVPGGRPALAAVVALLALVGVAASRGLRRRRTTAAAAPDRSPVPVGGPALAAFLRWDARLGPARRRQSESLAELRRRLGVDGDTAQALQVVEQECYAPEPPPAAETAARVLDRAPAPEGAQALGTPASR